MHRRSICALVLCLLLFFTAAQAFAQDIQPATPAESVQQAAPDSVALVFKYTKDDVDTYKVVVKMDVEMKPENPASTPMPPMNAQSVLVMRERILDVLANGDALKRMAFTSMSMNFMGQSQQIPTDTMPRMTMTVSPSGEIKSISGMEKLLHANPMVDMNNLGQYSFTLPDHPVKVGDTWTKEIPMPMNTNKMQVTCTLLSTNDQLGKYKVAKFSQSTTGDLDMSLPSDPGQSTPMKMSGKVMANGICSFSPELGKIIRSDGTADVQLLMNLPANSGPVSGKTTMNMKMKIEMFLLPTPAETSSQSGVQAAK